MTSRRTARAAKAIQETVSTAILFEVRDPRVKNVTVLHVEVSPDLRAAKVHVSVMGDVKRQRLCMHGLESARGFLQAKVADRIQTRYTPILTFVLDQGVKKSIEASRLIREALADGTSADGTSADEEFDEDDPAEDLLDDDLRDQFPDADESTEDAD